MGPSDAPSCDGSARMLEEARAAGASERELLKRRVRVLERALQRALRSVKRAEEQKRELEAWLFEERTRTSQRVASVRSQCTADAIDVAVDVVRRQHKIVVPSVATGYAERFLAHHADTVRESGAPLKETLLCVFHSHGQPPPISPAEALPAALACVDFAARVAPVLHTEHNPIAHGIFTPLLKGYYDDVFSRVATNLHGVTDRIVRRGRAQDIASQHHATQQDYTEIVDSRTNIANPVRLANQDGDHHTNATDAIAPAAKSLAEQLKPRGNSTANSRDTGSNDARIVDSVTTDMRSHAKARSEHDSDVIAGVS